MSVGCKPGFLVDGGVASVDVQLGCEVSEIAHGVLLGEVDPGSVEWLRDVLVLVQTHVESSTIVNVSDESRTWDFSLDYSERIRGFLEWSDHGPDKVTNSPLSDLWRIICTD
jgi:hypothetical protein